MTWRAVDAALRRCYHEGVIRALLAAAVLLAGCAGVGGGAFTDDFSGRTPGRCVRDGGPIGPWTVVSTGFGCVKVVEEGGQRWLHANTLSSTTAPETHAFLVTGPKAVAPFTWSARVSTVEQNRAAAPNAWESAWLVWGYRDRQHFYYLATKPGGWELGKRDPAYRGGQRFLASGESPQFPPRTWGTVTVAQSKDDEISVWSDGKLLARFPDAERPYHAGKVGFYGEDCWARFDDARLTAGVPDER